ncbi:MAG: DNRLRE domain-containing protein [Bacteroidia bacterium]
MKKNLYFILLSFISCQVFGQTTVTLGPSQDAAIGFHNGFNTANNNYNNATQFAAYCIPGTNTGINVNRALMQFDFSSIPAGAIITSANLNFYKIPVLGVLSGHTVGNNQSYLKRITQSWNEATVTWNNAPISTTDNQVILAAAVSPAQDFLNIDVLEMVQYFVANPLNNFGFLFGLVNETPTRVLGFCSNSYPEVELRPTLQVTYCVPSLLSITALGSATICEGGSVEINVEANSNFEWSDGGNQNPRTISSSGTYFVQSTGACASVSNSIEVLVNSNPVIPVISPSGVVNINEGSSVILTSSPASAYEWTPGGETSQSINVSVGGSYSVKVYNENDCFSVSTSTTVNVFPVIEPPAPSSCTAVEVISYEPAKQNDGIVLPDSRIIAGKALGVPQNNDNTVGEDDYNFVSLGFGGSITLRMSGPIANGEGNDLKVTETTFGTSSGNCTRYPETIMAFASQDACNWVYLGRGCQDTEFDLGELDWAEFVKLVDASPTDASYNGSVADGYDVDGVECLNGYRENPEMQDLGNSYAESVIDFAQGAKKNGTPVSMSRSFPELALGAPQNTNTVNFFSLGFGGSITLKLGYVVFDKEGNDIEVVETSYGNPSCASYSERALVEASLNGEDYFELGEICLDGMVDFSAQGLIAAQYIRITDRSAMSNFGSTADAYDLDGIIVLQPGCSTTNPDARKLEDLTSPDELGQISIAQGITKNFYSISFSSMEQSEKYVIEVYNISGQLVSSEKVSIPAATVTSHQANLNSLTDGIYLVRAQSATNSQSFKVIKN